MLTDEEALRLIEKVRRHTPHIDVVELCDWGLQQIQGRTALARVMTKVSEPVAPQSDRKAYMREYMKKRREVKADG
jgi:hypothetical protein